MAEPKTRPTDASVEKFLHAIADPRRRDDAIALDAVMASASGERPVMWGTSIVGYGSLVTAGKSAGKTAWPVIAFSPRKSELVMYLNTELDPALFESLGPHRRGIGCLYVKRLADVDPIALRRVLERSIELARGSA